ncbi:MAG: hypothetical protein AAF518_14230 [Spirochaetota bacterium]
MMLLATSSCLLVADFVNEQKAQKAESVSLDLFQGKAPNEWSQYWRQGREPLVGVLAKRLVVYHCDCFQLHNFRQTLEMLGGVVRFSDLEAPSVAVWLRVTDDSSGKKKLQQLRQFFAEPALSRSRMVWIKNAPWQAREGGRLQWNHDMSEDIFFKQEGHDLYFYCPFPPCDLRALDTYLAGSGTEKYVAKICDPDTERRMNLVRWAAPCPECGSKERELGLYKGQSLWSLYCSFTGKFFLSLVELLGDGESYLVDQTPATKKWSEAVLIDNVIRKFYETKDGTLYGYDARDFQLLYSEDEGISWSMYSLISMVEDRFIPLSKDTLIFLDNRDGGTVLQITYDRCVSWQELYNFASLQIRNDTVIFPEPNRGMFADKETALYRTEDGGKSWSKLKRPTGELLYMQATFEGRVYMLLRMGNADNRSRLKTMPHYLYYSDDLGITWKVKQELLLRNVQCFVIGFDETIYIGTGCGYIARIPK